MDTNIKIIGFTGKKGVGKSTAAQLLCVYYNKICRVSFAQPVKGAANRILHEASVDRVYYGNNKDEVIPALGVSYRQIVQAITRAGFDLKAGFWDTINFSLLNRYHKECEGKFIYAVDDIRYESTAQHIRDLGGVVVHLINPDEMANDMRINSNEEGEKTLEIKKGDKVIFNYKDDRLKDDLVLNLQAYIGQDNANL